MWQYVLINSKEEKIMKHIKEKTIFLVLMTALLFIACSKQEETTEENNTKNDVQIMNEEDLQTKNGINGELPDIQYTYEDIINGNTAGIIHPDDTAHPYYADTYLTSIEIYRQLVVNELAKIQPQNIPEDASDEEIEKFFKQLLYIVGEDYEPVESINRFSYVIFKKDEEHPFTHQRIHENQNINVEIILDASGSMSKKIGNESMMEIAKNSIEKVLSQMPSNAKVGLRVFGHLGNNTATGKEESCEANELIYPIDVLNVEGIKNALSPIQPTGWTSIAKSIENGIADLSQFQGEKDLNILYIITDGIETCGGDPLEVARNFKEQNTNIVLGIIGFNVDANQNKVLKEIATAAGGYYSSAKDAAKLTKELQNIHEMAFSDYKWQPFTEEMYQKIIDNHKYCLQWNHDLLKGKALSEKLNILEALARTEGNMCDLKMVKFQGIVNQKIRRMAEERMDTIKALYDEELEKRRRESEEYLLSLQNRIGETVAFIPMTSRLNPYSEYYTSFSDLRAKTSQSEIEESSQLNDGEEKKAPKQ